MRLRTVFSLLLGTASLAVLAMYLELFQAVPEAWAHLMHNLAGLRPDTWFQPAPPLSKIMLLWTPFFGVREWFRQTLEDLGCEASECPVTFNRSQLTNSAAVLFHWRDLDAKDLPPRLTQQRWIMFNFEAPPHTPHQVVQQVGKLADWVVTYRRDADIYAPYGSFRSLSRQERHDLQELDAQAVDTDRKLVVWLVSNCHTASRREDYVRQLREHADVDVFGKCGERPLPARHAREYYAYLSKRYLFYLSFENAMCKDYVTEKVFYALQSGMVPVVYGGADYKLILPPNSYIDALNFSSPRELGRYLQFVADHDNLYRGYHAWRKEYMVEERGYGWLCDVCRALLDPSPPRQRRRNLMQWWFGTAKCRSWSDNQLIEQVFYV